VRTVKSAGCGDRNLKRLEILVLSMDTKNCATLRSILGRTNWVCHFVPDIPRAMLFLENHFVPVVLCPKNLPDATWKDVVAVMGRFLIPPKVLVYTEHADDAFWIEVLNSGGYDLLIVPFNSDEVLRLVGLAGRHWKDDAKKLEQCVFVKAG
jgi:DNA-binding NtrC family response regulator